LKLNNLIRFIFWKFIWCFNFSNTPSYYKQVIQFLTD